MSAARTVLRTIFLLLGILLIGGTSSYAQSAASLLPTMFKAGSRTSSGAWLARCEPRSLNVLVGWRLDNGTELPPIESELTGDSNIRLAIDGACLERATDVPDRPSVENPCLHRAFAGPGRSGTFRCAESGDTVSADLLGLGKAGQKIARAREEVLAILRYENACTEWFETLDKKPAKTFESLSFSVDQRGPQNIIESMRSRSMFTLWEPYVAQATQDGGAYTTIMINANGAFYRSQAPLQKTSIEGGPLVAEGMHVLTVGSYAGNTLSAQMVTLLHEFGHIIDLLPEDADDLDGKSVRNTDNVVRHCRTEVEARAELAKQSAKR